MAIIRREGREIVWVNGSPKSGNTWLVRLVAEALNSPIGGSRRRPISDEGEYRQGKYFVFHEHLVERVDGDNKVIYIYRDPRDVIVSALYYWETGTIAAAIEKESWRIKRFYDYWFVGDMADAYVSYEQLKDDTEFHLRRVLEEADLDIDANLSVVVAHQEFSAKKERIRLDGYRRPGGRDRQLRFLRKGIVGDWRNHFTRSDAERFDRLNGEQIRGYGYEVDSSWVQECPTHFDREDLL